MNPMALSYDQHFQSAIAQLKMENRYRVFANLERDAARFPLALWRPEGEENAPREVTIWCSNDYLGMGGHPASLDAARQAPGAAWRRRGRNAQHIGHPSPDRRVGS